MKLRKWTLFAVAVSSGMLATADIEEKIAVFPETESKMYNIGASKRYRKDVDARIAAYRKLIQQFPDLDVAADAAKLIINSEFKRKKYASAVKEISAFLKDYEKYDSLCLNFKVLLARIVRDKKVPADVRSKAFNVLLDNCRGLGGNCAGLRNWISARKDLDAKQKYELILKLTKVSENGNDPSGVCWFFASKYIAGLSDLQQKIKVCKEYLGSFDKDSLLYPQVYSTLLSYEASAGNAEAKAKLKELRKKEKIEIKELKILFNKAFDAMKTGDYSAAVKELSVLREKKYPRQLTINGWSRISSQLKKCPPEKLQELLDLAIDTTHPRGINNNFLNKFADPAYYATPELAGRNIKLVKKYFNSFKLADADVAQKMNFLRHRLKRTLPDVVKTPMFVVMAEIVKQHKIRDFEVEFFFTAGTGIMQKNRELAVKYLKNAAECGIDNKEAAQAKWLYELLTGSKKLPQSAAPRFLPERLVFKKAPELSLATTVKDNPKVKEAKGFFTAVKENAVLDVNAVSSNEKGNKSISKAFDNSNDTAWVPEKLPATLIVPLKNTASLRQIKVNAEYALEYTITLLDKNGKKLRQFQRMGLLIYAGRYYPKEKAVIDFTPCDDVAAMQFTIYRRMAREDGIRDIKIASSDYAMRSVKILSSSTVPAGKETMLMAYDSKPVNMKVEYPGNWFSYYRRQWYDPWRKDKYFKLSKLDFSLGIYGGSKLTLNFIHNGAVDWQLDGKTKGRIENENNAKSKVFIPELGNGLHLLNFIGSSLKGGNDKHGADGMQFRGLQLSGKASGYYVARFKCNGKWTGWFSGKKIKIPAGAKNYQLAAIIDSREVLGKASAQLGKCTVSFSSAGGKTEKYSLDEPSFINDEPAALAAYIEKYRPAIAFSKNGTKAEYEAAKELAEKAGCYLISDDVEFNNRDQKKPVLAVGTPLINRYCRSLVSRLLVWRDKKFLNSHEGFAMPEPTSLEPGSAFAFICGDTPEATIAALKRVLEKVKPYKAKEDFTLFKVPLLERVFPWQLHTTAPRVRELSLELGRNDRRSVKAGVTFDRKTDDFKVVCSELKSDSGKSVPAPRIRYTGYYEWAFFFGDVRQPDMLLDQPVLPIAANTASCVWITVDTDKNTPPGKYRGKLTFSSGDCKKVIPLEVNILPLTIPDGRISSYDYYGVPYWFEPDSPGFWRMFRKLTINQIEHGVNKIKVLDFGDYKLVNGKVVFNFDFLLKQIKTADKLFKEKGGKVPDLYFPAPNLQHQSTIIYQRDKNKMLDSLRENYSRQLASAMKKYGCWERTWLKVGDEPGNMPKWLKYARPYKKGGMKVWTTSGKKEMDEVTDAWCPVYVHNVHAEHLLKEIQKGKRPVWWYTCAGGGPGMWITGPLVNIMPIYWLTAKWNFAGVDNYGALAVSNAFSFPYRYSNGHNFRVLVTPDEEVIDTARREIESDGLHDCRLAYMVKDRIAKLPKTQAAELKKKFDAIMSEIVPYKYSYSMDPEKWAEARYKLYQLAIKYKK